MGQALYGHTDINALLPRLQVQWLGSHCPEMRKTRAPVERQFSGRFLLKRIFKTQMYHSVQAQNECGLSIVRSPTVSSATTLRT